MEKIVNTTSPMHLGLFVMAMACTALPAMAEGLSRSYPVQADQSANGATVTTGNAGSSRAVEPGASPKLTVRIPGSVIEDKRDAPKISHPMLLDPPGRIGEKYKALGRRQGPLGAPVGSEVDAPNGGRSHDFKNGAIFWHPQIGEAFAVWGAILQKFNEMGGVEYGYPITDERPTPDQRGRYNHFRALHVAGQPVASIYWTPQTGAHAIYGAIRDAWAGGGWERGELGYPTSDEFQDGQFRRVDFERGYILWSKNAGIQIRKSGEKVRISGGGSEIFDTLLVTGMEVSVKDKVLGGDATFLSENTVCRFYQQALDDINVTLKDLARSNANPRMGGFSIRSDAEMHMSPDCSFRAEVLTACADTVSMRMLLPGNKFKFHVTTPTVFGSWSDPEFTVTFDLVASAKIRMPRNSNDSFGLGPVMLDVSGIKLDSQNVTGDALLAVKKVYEYFGGNDLAAQLTQNRNFKFGGITTSLARLSSEAKRIPTNYRTEACLVGNGNMLRLNGTNEVYKEPVIH